MVRYEKTRKALIDTLEPLALDGEHHDPPTDDELSGFLMALSLDDRRLVAAIGFVTRRKFAVPDDFYAPVGVESKRVH